MVGSAHGQLDVEISFSDPHMCVYMLAVVWKRITSMACNRWVDVFPVWHLCPQNHGFCSKCVLATASQIIGKQPGDMFEEGHPTFIVH
jgi:hypothetical protein